MLLEWDEGKRKSNLIKHGLDFRDAHHIFDGQKVYTCLSPRGDEKRLISVGMVGNRIVAVIWVERDEVSHIISMRRARDEEKGAYRALLD
jgi:uncharacterized protein